MMLNPISTQSVIVCDQCDSLLQEAALEPGGKAVCASCDNVLYRSQPHGMLLSLVFSLTAAILFLISNAFPIVTISAQGLTNSTTLLDAVYRLISDGIPSIAMLVLVTTFLMPAAISASQHGPVRPKWEQGSRVT